MRLFFSSFLALMFSVALLQAQDRFTWEFEGETYQLSQELDPAYLGVYVKQEGEQKWQYGLYADREKSFYLQQTAQADAIKYEWNLDNKKPIRWGLVIDAQGQPLKSTVSEWIDGERRDFQAFTILIEHLPSGKIESLHLYEYRGQFCLGYACRVNETASSGGQK